jgi:hypothetical protein
VKKPQRFVERRPTIDAMQFTGDNFKDLKQWVKSIVPDARVPNDAGSDATGAVPDFAQIVIGRDSPRPFSIGISTGDWLVRLGGSTDAPFTKVSNDVFTAMWEPDTTTTAAGTVR